MNLDSCTPTELYADLKRPAARNSAFFWRTGEPSAFADLQVNAGRSAKLAQNHYSPEIEGREAGERSMHKRDALKRSRI